MTATLGRGAYLGAALSVPSDALPASSDLGDVIHAGLGKSAAPGGAGHEPPRECPGRPHGTRRDAPARAPSQIAKKVADKTRETYGEL